MKKPDSLRRALTGAVTELAQNPEKLHCFIQEGRISSTSARSLSFEYAYTLEIIVTDYNADPDTIIVPILAWLRVHQNEMLSNPELMQDGFSFEADILNHDTVDLAIKLKLSERVGVHEEEGHYVIEHYEEPVAEDDVFNMRASTLQDSAL